MPMMRVRREFLLTFLIKVSDEAAVIAGARQLLRKDGITLDENDPDGETMTLEEAIEILATSEEPPPGMVVEHYGDLEEVMIPS